MTDTIFALSSGRLPAGIAVVRVSGPQAGVALERLAGGIPKPRLASLRTIRDLGDSIIDHALVLWFPGPKSETGEDCAELQLHGGRAVVAKMLDTLGALPGCRLAEPGEFIRRAFLNGKLDLVQVEALGDLVNAETEAQRRFAIENSSEAQSRLYGDWRRRLLHARAMIEAELDFADEGDVPGSVSEQVWSDIAGLIVEMRGHADGFAKSEIIRDGFRVVLAGAPNTGKSSLLNALAKRDVAIVSDEPGTTRDVIEVALDLGGVKVVVSDTAGLRDGATGVEAIGIGRTRDRIASAHLVLSLDEEGLQEASGTTGDAILIANKADLGGPVPNDAILSVSAKTGEGIDTLVAVLKEMALGATSDLVEVLPSRARHVALLGDAVGQLSGAVDGPSDLELRAESLRLAERSVGKMVGAVDSEELLGAIFSNFCVGK